MTTEVPKGVAAVLDHCTGSKVYLIGVAHVSREAAEDVRSAILELTPRIVFLELDKERYEALMKEMQSSDKYGLERLSLPKRKLIPMILNGTAPLYLLSTMYVVAGALLGAPAGVEFTTAIQAANQVAAEIVLGDRPQEITIKRLMFRAAQLAAERARARRTPLSQADSDIGLIPPSSSGSGQEIAVRPSSSSLTDTMKATSRSGDTDNSPKSVTAESSTVSEGQEQSWGLDDDYVLPGQKRPKGALTDVETWKRLLQTGGCEDADEVVRAFHRIVEAGAKGRPIPATDILIVRGCGRKMVENLRNKALQEGDAALRELEGNALAGVKGAAGLQPSLEALNEVMGHERDIVLTRHLWETAEKANGARVVGVVGAAHVPAIRSMWPEAGTPEFQHLCKAYMTVPQQPRLGFSTTIPTIATGALLGYITWKRPRLALTMAAAAAVVTAPYLGFAMAALNRWQGFAKNLVKACETVDAMEQTGDVGDSFSAMP
ncbi:g1589 [Coccomyxa elongata]